MLNAETLSPRVSSEDIRVRMRQKFKSNNRLCSSPSLLFPYSLPPSLPPSPDSSLQLAPPQHLPFATSPVLSYTTHTVSSMPMQTLWLMTSWPHSTARYVLPTSRGLHTHTTHVHSTSQLTTIMSTHLFLDIYLLTSSL